MRCSATPRPRDWSSDGRRGHEHEAAIVVWAKPGSARSALAAAERMADLLHDAPLALSGHRLVLIRATALEGGRDDATNLARATLRLRALTEVVCPSAVIAAARSATGIQVTPVLR